MRVHFSPIEPSGITPPLSAGEQPASPAPTALPADETPAVNPAEAVSLQRLASAPTIARIDDPAPSQPKQKTILVADDDEGILPLVRLTLEAQGYRVILAKDLDEGIRALDENPVDMLITDKNLVSSQGGLLLALKAKGKGITTILISGSGGLKDVDLQEHGISQAISKPFAPSALASIVNGTFSEQVIYGEREFNSQTTQTKTEFARNLRHLFNNYRTSLNGYIELLAMMPANFSLLDELIKATDAPLEFSEAFSPESEVQFFRGCGDSPVIFTSEAKGYKDQLDGATKLDRDSLYSECDFPFIHKEIQKPLVDFKQYVNRLKREQTPITTEVLQELNKKYELISSSWDSVIHHLTSESASEPTPQ